MRVFKCLWVALVLVAVDQHAFAADIRLKSAKRTEELPVPCPTKASRATVDTACCKSDAAAKPEGFAKILLCIADELCQLDSKQLCERDQVALIEHIKDTLAALGSLEDTNLRNRVQNELSTALATNECKSDVAREVLAQIASLPSAAAKQVKIKTRLEKNGADCLKSDCETTETTEITADPLAPAPLSTATVEAIKKKLCKLQCCCRPAGKCPDGGKCGPCGLASGYERRWQLINVLIMDAERLPQKIREILAPYPAMSMLLGLTELPNGVTADDFWRWLNIKTIAEVLEAELCNYRKLIGSPCGVRILLRVIDGVANVYAPFEQKSNMSPLGARSL
ncbi:MAG: hypothetical protein K2Y37_24125 [Pirellulales bacterium]|nr:hypothetical protein [Pirellulales bacterium]